MAAKKEVIPCAICGAPATKNAVDVEYGFDLQFGLPTYQLRNFRNVCDEHDTPAEYIWIGEWYKGQRYEPGEQIPLLKIDA